MDRVLVAFKCGNSEYDGFNLYSYDEFALFWNKIQGVDKSEFLDFELYSHIGSLRFRDFEDLTSSIKVSYEKDSQFPFSAISETLGNRFGFSDALETIYDYLND